jgi:negative regulator of sigma E activity
VEYVDLMRRLFRDAPAANEVSSSRPWNSIQQLFRAMSRCDEAHVAAVRAAVLRGKDPMQGQEGARDEPASGLIQWRAN